METSVKTIGGSPFFSNFSIPTKVDNADINLSQWVSSLNDKNTHKIIDIADEGLIPITEFMLEENMKKDFKYFIEKWSSFHNTNTRTIFGNQSCYFKWYFAFTGNNNISHSI